MVGFNQAQPKANLTSGQLTEVFAIKLYYILWTDINIDVVLG